MNDKSHLTYEFMINSIQLLYYVHIAIAQYTLHYLARIPHAVHITLSEIHPIKNVMPKVSSYYSSIVIYYH